MPPETDIRPYLDLPGDNGARILAPDWAAVGKLYAKIAAAMAALPTVHRNAQHGQGWKYSSWDEIAEAIRSAMIAAKLAHSISIDRVDHVDARTARADITITLTDTETGAHLRMRWTADAIETTQTPTGAAATKAITAAVKQALSKALLISADDEPGEKPTTLKPAAQAKTQAMPAQPPAPTQAKPQAAPDQATTNHAQRPPDFTTDPPPAQATPANVNPTTGEIGQPYTLARFTKALNARKLTPAAVKKVLADHGALKPTDLDGDMLRMATDLLESDTPL